LTREVARSRYIGYLALGCAIVVSSLCGGLVWAVRTVPDQIADVYAIEQAISTLQTYVMDHQGKWPDGWNDLRESFVKVFAAGQNTNSFDEVQRRVRIDFTPANSEAAATLAKEAIIFELTSGRDVCLTSDLPNIRLLQFLQRYNNALKTGRPLQGGAPGIEYPDHPKSYRHPVPDAGWNDL